MIQEFLGARGQLLIWPLIGLGIFVASFIAVLVFVFSGLHDRGKRDRLAALPLENDEANIGAKDGKGD